MEKLIETIVEGIQDKKGKDIVSLDLTGFDGAMVGITPKRMVPEISPLSC